MQSLLRTALGVASLLLVASPLYAQFSAQPTASEIIIPKSSIEYPDDIGVRAHTYDLIYTHHGDLNPMGGLGPYGGMTPAQMRSFYNLPSTGGSQIIAIVDAFDFPTSLSDFNAFSSYFGLPTETSSNVLSSSNKVFQVVYASGSKPADGSGNNWALEEALDIEWAHAMAPNAKIVLVECNSASYTDLFTGVSVATSFSDSNGWHAKEVSMSWGGSEFSGETSYDSYFASSSVVYFASAGDSGAPAQYPSSSPYLISAGGTHVSTNSSGAFTGESAWSSGGGGPSSQESRPSFQNAIQYIASSSRGTPDLSYDADPATGACLYDTYYGGWINGTIGGTSWSSPALAACLNVADTSAGSWAAGSQAELAILYSNLGSSNFRDITSGNNGYPAKNGWDFTTGVGTLQGLTGLTTTLIPGISSLSPSSATAGGTAFTLTVNGTNFVSNATANGATVYWNSTALTTTYVSSTQLTASVPAGDIASAGTASVTVHQNNQTSSAATFTISGTTSVPTLTKIAPTSVLAGGPSFTLTATGTNFASNSVVQWTAGTTTTSLTTTYVSSTTLTASVPASLIATHGTAKITVYTPGGGTSSAKSISIKQTSLALSLTSLVKNSDGSFTAKVSLKNTGYLTASSLQVTTSTLGVAATSTTLPVSLGNLAAGSSASTSLTYPSSAGTSGTKVTLKVISKFTAGTSSNTLKVTLP